MTKKKSSELWFPAKSYGWGWGLPKVWQGWVALLVCLAVGLAPITYVSTMYKGDTYCKDVIAKGITTNCNPDAVTPVYLIASLLWLVAWVLVLTQICYSKGEKPTWKWSSNKNEKKHATKPRS